MKIEDLKSKLEALQQDAVKIERGHAEVIGAMKMTAKLIQEMENPPKEEEKKEEVKKDEEKKSSEKVDTK